MYRILVNKLKGRKYKPRLRDNTRVDHCWLWTAIVLSPLVPVHCYSLLSIHTLAKWSCTNGILVRNLICLCHLLKVMETLTETVVLLVRPQLLFVNAEENRSSLINHDSWAKHHLMWKAEGIQCFKQNCTKLWIWGKLYRMLNQSYPGTYNESAVNISDINDVKIVTC